jgi:hypothetical protein
MSRFSIIIFSFFYPKISRNEEIFSKNSGKFSVAAAENQKVSSRRRRERHRLTPLIIHTIQMQIVHMNYNKDLL